MMKIAFDARGINWYKGTGIGTYTENLLKSLLTIDNENKYSIYWSGQDYKTFEKTNSSIKMASKRYHRFFQEHYFPADIKNNSIDIYHISQNGIGLSENIDCLKVVTIHDLIPYIMPETVGKGYLLKFLKYIPRIIEASDGIITVSNCSKNDILKYFPVDPNKIFVTPLATDKIYKPIDKKYCKDYLSKKYGVNNNFILYIGGFSPRKNVNLLIKAFEMVKSSVEDDIKLLICGARKDAIEKLQALSHNSKVSESIIFTDYVEGYDLPIFYNACEIFVYPSLYEGFGLPPLEAMSCGAPVITSNISSISEVVNDGALLINPTDADELASNMYHLLTDKDTRDAWSKKGLLQANGFSWIKTAEETLAVYKTVMEKQLTVSR
jgi:glycosyltransferase involved in cell wall biosynthesis